MDTKYDFIRPEFLNILFFQQKSVVIFPYVDVKHLHSMEIFALGYNIVDLDSTAIYNLNEILELERSNYSQNPSFFFITNVSIKQLSELINLNNIHCIINSNEDIKNYATGENFIFFNKKNNIFLNYTPKDLALEEFLITSSKNMSVLQDRILKIKTIATNLFTELNDGGNIHTLSNILSDIEPQYWNKIIEYTHLYYGIEVPDIPLKPQSPPQESQLFANIFSHEYDFIMSKNKYIGKEFVQLIHEYRINHVNSANLDVKQLFFPRNLYNYLRNRHWKKGIDEKFLQEWVQMNVTNYQLSEADISDFEEIFQFLHAPLSIISNRSSHVIDETKLDFSSKFETYDAEIPQEIPLTTNLQQYKPLVLEQLDKIEVLIEQNLAIEEVEYGMQDFLAIKELIKFGTTNSKKDFLKGDANKRQITDKKLYIKPISDPDINKILKTAESLFVNHALLEDTSPIFIQYAKGLEAILHEKISSKLNPLVAKYQKLYYNKKISLDFKKKFGNLMKGKSIPLGPWISIFNNLYKHTEDIYMQDLFNVIKSHFNDSVLRILKQACKVLAPLRNKPSHSKVCTFEEVVSNRVTVIKVLNSVIKALYE